MLGDISLSYSESEGNYRDDDDDDDDDARSNLTVHISSVLERNFFPLNLT